jgi:hypothetical protein
MFEGAKEWVESVVASNFAGPAPRGLPALPPIARVSPLVVRVLGRAWQILVATFYSVGTRCEPLELNGTL